MADRGRRVCSRESGRSALLRGNVRGAGRDEVIGEKLTGCQRSSYAAVLLEHLNRRGPVGIGPPTERLTLGIGCHPGLPRNLELALDDRLVDGLRVFLHGCRRFVRMLSGVEETFDRRWNECPKKVGIALDQVLMGDDSVADHVDAVVGK